jgi:undecaprenyl-diphosphatase
VFGSGLFQLYKSIKDPCVTASKAVLSSTACTPEIFGPVETAAATIVAFGVGLLVIAFFMGYISRRSFLPFVIYRIALGVLLIVLLSTGVMTA